ncbi:hypothetical protein [Bradyrhizobium erythrophlei]|uniref:Uncharacterized protein n=1 Tax=Bradyrhizobium erythrophlei TaxID=1437360 RepID=A0A1M7TRT6_9BRAD|nr:hypothetical protein [Bradyrhizobium erythrophlei]SHN73469.1 hypothetical protein SAMN05444170_2485 [Bradyrhizobium erythrophlei]
MARRTPPGRNTAIPQADRPLIAIRAHDDNKELIEEFVPGKAAPVIVRMAMHWGYILRVRTRWSGAPDMRDYFGTKAIDDLAELGIGRDAMQRFASAEHIEVELYRDGSATSDAAQFLDAASEIPWEYLLSSATRNIGRFESLLVTRCFSNGSAVTPSKPRNVLFVESSPGRIEQKYEFEDEEERINAAVNIRGKKELEFSRTEPFSKLKARVHSRAWEAIHVTGIDTHQVAWLIEDFYTAVARKADVIDKTDHLHDGMILRGDYDSELPVRYDELADLLLESKRPPFIITLNLYYSGARTARELVKRGAYAAIGFLDEIDDEFAERFFQAFYWAWCHRSRPIPAAFLEAWSTMDGERMHGTAIVIWLGRSIIKRSDAREKRRFTSARRRSGDR